MRKDLDGEHHPHRGKIKVDHGDRTQQLAKRLMQVGEEKRNLRKDGGKKILIQMEVQEQVPGEKQRMKEALQVEVVGEHLRIRVLIAEEGLLIKDGETTITTAMEMEILQDGEQQIMMLLDRLEEVDGEVTKEEEEVVVVVVVEIIKEMEVDLITTIAMEDTENLIGITTITMKETMETGKEVVDLSITIIIARMEVVELEDGKITAMKGNKVDIRKEIAEIMALVEVGKVQAIMILAADGGIQIIIIIIKVKEITTITATTVAVEG